jgi:16S rRNA (adenine1518-N6/adenine1519-N6)-dimethyltransferase
MIHKAKKSLGQNFLKSNLALNKIIEAGEISPNDIILEIGPGKGALTEKLLEKADLVIAVEKDQNLFALLQEKFFEEISAGKLILIERDILEFKITDEIFKTFHPPLNYKIIANIPYNITGAILKKFLTEEIQPTIMVLMIQQEVAQRIIARDKKESILSISVKAYGEPKMILKVPARHFSPAPKVNSAVITIKNISRKFFEENKINEEKFWEIVHAGFAHKRKKLSNNLKKSIKNIPEEYKDKRAEDLSLSDWLNLAKIKN